MSFPEDPDKPLFDLVQFEADAQARATELIDQVSRLAVIHSTDQEDTMLQKRGASYDLADATRVEVSHAMHDENPDSVIVKARITQPPLEVLGHDGQLRRVTLSRFVMYNGLAEPPETETETDEDAFDRFGEDPAIEGEDRAMRELEELQFEHQAHPEFHPKELIDAQTVVLVENKLPGSKPNFRTERYSDSMSEATKSAHMIARREAGESEDDPSPEYSIPEHKALIAQLAGIDPELGDPQPPEDDLQESEYDIFRWDSPSIARSWRPRPKQD